MITRILIYRLFRFNLVDWFVFTLDLLFVLIGGFVQFDIGTFEYSHITATKPVQVFQYVKTSENANEDPADPAMMVKAYCNFRCSQQYTITCSISSVNSLFMCITASSYQREFTCMYQCVTSTCIDVLHFVLGYFAIYCY